MPAFENISSLPHYRYITVGIEHEKILNCQTLLKATSDFYNYINLMLDPAHLSLELFSITTEHVFHELLKVLSVIRHC